MRNFMELLKARWAQGKFLCVGLDSDIAKVRPLVHSEIPADYQAVDASDEDSLFEFNERIIHATAQFACAYKPNRAFFAKSGMPGAMALARTINYLHFTHPDIPVIFDAKEGDIDNTNNGYAVEAFDLYRADALTVHPYMGGEANKPFLDYVDKGIIVLARTSNKGAGEFQDREVSIPEIEYDYLQDLGVKPLSHSPNVMLTSFSNHVAYRVAKHWNVNGNCAVVVGATAPEELKFIRRIVGNMPILIPGIGAQGGDVQVTVEAGQDENGEGMIINASRSVIFNSSDPDEYAQAAADESKRLHDLINEFRKSTKI